MFIYLHLCISIQLRAYACTTGAHDEEYISMIGPFSLKLYILPKALSHCNISEIGEFSLMIDLKRPVSLFPLD